jgi:hypothetical protein
MTGRVRSRLTRRATASDQPLTFCSPSGRLTGHASPASDRTRRYKTLATHAWLLLPLTGRVQSYRDRVQSLPVTSVRLHFFAESCLASSAGGRVSLHTSPPLKQHLLHKMCQHHQVYITICMCVSIFTIILKEFTTQLATPLDPSNDV